jgi:hypothetical protein
VLRNLVLVVTGQFQAILDEKKRFDLEAYRAALDRLPLPTFEEFTSAMVQMERQPIDEVLVRYFDGAKTPGSSAVTTTPNGPAATP